MTCARAPSSSGFAIGWGLGLAREDRSSSSSPKRLRNAALDRKRGGEMRGRYGVRSGPRNAFIGVSGGMNHRMIATWMKAERQRTAKE